MQPEAFCTNRGSQPTDRHARTGEFTPPGIHVLAWVKSWADLVVFIGAPIFAAVVGLVLV
jgi:hypothetical protein